MSADMSPFALHGNPVLAAGKFADPHMTAMGEPRASVIMTGLDTLWFKKYIEGFYHREKELKEITQRNTFYFRYFFHFQFLA